MLYELLSSISGVINALILYEDVTQPLHSLFNLLQVYLHGPRNHNSNHIPESLCHLSNVFHDLFVLLIYCQLLNCHDMFEHYHSAWRIYDSLLNCWRLDETTHRFEFFQNCIDVAIRAKLI